MKDEAEQWAARWGVPLALALLAIVARALLSTERATWLGISRTVVVGLFLGACTNLYLANANLLTDGARGAVVGVAAVLAEDLLLALLRVGRRFRDEPFVVVDLLLSVFSRTQAVRCGETLPQAVEQKRDSKSDERQASQSSSGWPPRSAPSSPCGPVCWTPSNDSCASGTPAATDLDTRPTTHGFLFAMATRSKEACDCRLENSKSCTPTAQRNGREVLGQLPRRRHQSVGCTYSHRPPRLHCAESCSPFRAPVG